MQITFDKDEREMVHVITLKITDSELIRVILDPLDRLLIADVEASNSIADKLLALETIARRIESAIKQERETCAQLAEGIAHSYEQYTGLNSEGDACRDVAIAIRNQNQSSQR